MADVVYFLDTLMNVLANGVEATMIYEILNPKTDNVFKSQSPSVIRVKFHAQQTPRTDVLKAAPTTLNVKQIKLIRERAREFANNKYAKDVIKKQIDYVSELVESHRYANMSDERDAVLKHLYNIANLHQHLIKDLDEADEEERGALSGLVDTTFDIKGFMMKVRYFLSLGNRIKVSWRKYKEKRIENGLGDISDSFLDAKNIGREIGTAFDGLFGKNGIITKGVATGIAIFSVDMAKSIASFIYHGILKKAVKAMAKLIAKWAAKIVAAVALSAFGIVLSVPTGGAAGAAALAVDALFIADSIKDLYDFGKEIVEGIYDYAKGVGQKIDNMAEMAKNFVHAISNLFNMSDGDFFESSRNLSLQYKSDYILPDAFKSKRIINVLKDDGTTELVEINLAADNEFFRVCIMFENIINGISSRIIKSGSQLKESIYNWLHETLSKDYNIDISQTAKVIDDIKENAVTVKHTVSTMINSKEFEKMDIKKRLLSDFLLERISDNNVVISKKNKNGVYEDISIDVLEYLKGENGIFDILSFTKQYEKYRGLRKQNDESDAEDVDIIKSQERPFAVITDRVAARAVEERKRADNIGKYCRTMNNIFDIKEKELVNG